MAPCEAGSYAVGGALCIRQRQVGRVVGWLDGWMDRKGGDGLEFNTQKKQTSFQGDQWNRTKNNIKNNILFVFFLTSLLGQRVWL